MRREVTPFRGLTTEQARELRKQQLAAQRWAIETGGFTWSGYRIPTDALGQGKIGNGFNLAQRRKATGDTRPFKWKLASGAWVSLTCDQVIEMATLIGEFVEACFAHEEALSSAIDAASDMTVVDITAGWPVDHD